MLFYLLFFLWSSPTRAEVNPAPLLEREWIRLESYKPFYFLLGRPEAKGQISLKAQAAKGFNLYFAYSQLVFWDLFKESSPIRDVNYNPEIFYRWEMNGASSFLDFGAYEHESNGKGGLDSRSWDRSYLRYSRNYSWTDNRMFAWSIKAFIPYRKDPTNRDITRYRGLWEAQIILTQNLGLLFDINEVIFRFYPGGRSRTNPLEGGRELTFRGKIALNHLSVPLVFQIFQGRGESLLEYQQKKLGLRAGFGF